MKTGILIFLLCLSPCGWIAPSLAASSRAREGEAAEHNRRGGRLFLQARYQEAVAEFESSLRINPRQVPVIKILGLCHQLRGDAAAAEQAFLKASRLSPKDAEVWFYLARLYWTDSFFDKAMRAVETSLKHNPRDWRAQELKGMTLEAEGEIEAALTAFREAIRLNEQSSRPAYSPAYNYGRLLRTLNRFEESEPMLRRARTLNPDEWRPHFDLGQLFRSTGRLEQAAAAFRDALETRSANREEATRIYRVLAQVYFRLGRREKARKASALAEQPRSGANPAP